MSLSPQKCILSSDDDDDSELPSLSERIKDFSSPPKTLEIMASDDENEVKAFLKSPKKVLSPCLNIKLNFSATSDSENEDSGIFNFSGKVQNTHQSNIVKYSENEDSDSDETFSNTLQRLSEMCTPRVQHRNYHETSESNSSEIFSNFSERLSKINTSKVENEEKFSANEFDDAENLHEFRTPLPPNRKNYSKGKDSDSDDSFSDFVEKIRTPMSHSRKNYSKVKDSDSDDSFSNFIEKIRTPLSHSRKNYSKVKDSDSDDSFSNFVEKIRTPMSHSRKKQCGANESDIDDSFLNSARKLQAFHTPMSQRKSRRDSLLMPIFSENKRMCHSTTSLTEGVSNSLKVCKSQNQKEFDALFPPETVNSTFCRNRTTYTHKLYDYFNRKIFDSQLPEDMPLKYDGSLKTTAGLTLCSYERDIYSCSIKLSSELLISFDRLKNTLLHEMCHAAVWIINKRKKVRHGPLWQIWASRCKLILPFVECPLRCHNYDISYSVWYHCPKCNWKKGRCKRVRKYEGARCTRCKTPIVMNFS